MLFLFVLDLEKHTLTDGEEEEAGHSIVSKKEGKSKHCVD